MNQEIRATRLEDIYNAFHLDDLSENSPFYVDVNEARNGKNCPTTSKKIIYLLNRCHRNNFRMPVDRFEYCKVLFVGHRACGKTTELHRIERALQSDYETLFISNIEEQQDRIGTQPDFLYYIVEKLVEFCEEHESYTHATQKQIEKLFELLDNQIFGEFNKITSIGDKENVQLEAGIDMTFKPIPSILKLMSKLSAKASFETSMQETLNKRIRYYINDFVDIANEILKAIREQARKNNKMPLLIIDGLDKINKDLATEIFLSNQSFLSQLQTSMIITYPIFLNYSPEHERARAPFGENLYILSMIPVHERNGADCDFGIEKLMEIVEKRMDIDNLVENREDVKQAIRNSGGNLRDLFNYICSAADSADIMGADKIRKSDFEQAYREKSNTLKRQALVETYMKKLSEIYKDNDKTRILRETPEDTVMLDMFSAGILIEYNGERWIDMHPLIKNVVKEWVENQTT